MSNTSMLYVSWLYCFPCFAFFLQSFSGQFVNVQGQHFHQQRVLDEYKEKNVNKIWTKGKRCSELMQELQQEDKKPATCVQEWPLFKVNREKQMSLAPCTSWERQAACFFSKLSLHMASCSMFHSPLLLFITICVWAVYLFMWQRRHNLLDTWKQLWPASVRETNYETSWLNKQQISQLFSFSFLPALHLCILLYLFSSLYLLAFSCWLHFFTLTFTLILCAMQVPSHFYSCWRWTCLPLCTCSGHIYEDTHTLAWETSQFSPVWDIEAHSFINEGTRGEKITLCTQTPANEELTDEGDGKKLPPASLSLSCWCCSAPAPLFRVPVSRPLPLLHPHTARTGT